MSRTPSGILGVDKPQGLTSHDVVDRVRGVLGIRKVGHTGTLDPMATGVMVICFGRMTRLSDYLSGQDKGYTTRFHLGVSTDTLDADGKVTARSDGPLPDLPALEQALQGFEGDILQVAPMYSARKHDGRRLHELARAGEEVKREPRRVRIHRIVVHTYEPPFLDLSVSCSKGTYIRTLADDLGTKIGCGAHLSRLRRTSVGSIGLDRCNTLHDLQMLGSEGAVAASFIDPLEALPDLCCVNLDSLQARAFLHGNTVDNLEPGERGACGEVSVRNHTGTFLGIGKWESGGPGLRPVRVIEEPETLDARSYAPGPS